MRSRTRAQVFSHLLRTDIRYRFSVWFGSDNYYGGHSASGDNAVDYFLVASESDTIGPDTPQNYSVY
jgi:hypothetical protein